MSTFLYSSAAKVAPECLSPSSHVLITQIIKKAMDSSTSPDVRITSIDNLSDDMIKPMILTFDQKIRLNPSLISPPAAGHHSPGHAISPTAGHTTDEYDQQNVISSCAYQDPAASPEGELWLKQTELDDRPSSPSVKSVSLHERPPSPSNEGPAKVQKISPAYQQTELDNDRPPSPSTFKSEKVQVTREPADQTQLCKNRPASPPYPTATKPRTQAIQKADYQSPSPPSGQPKMQMISEAAPYEASRAHANDKLSGMMESCRSPARRLSRVVEESESFSRREFGPNVLLYMSTHASANHAENFSTHSSYNHANFSSKLPSYHHNNHLDFSYTHSSRPPANFTNSKSAPAGFAMRTKSAFALFRRGSSEGGKLGGRVVYHKGRPRKPKSLGHTLLWPLLKVKNGYVGCMMGLEGSGNLSGMAQGGTYASRAQYFADIPLSKTDSKNHG